MSSNVIHFGGEVLPGITLPSRPTSFPMRFDRDTFLARDVPVNVSGKNAEDPAVLAESVLSRFSTPDVEAKGVSPQLHGPVPLDIEIKNEDGALFGLSDLSFTVRQSATGEIVFSNEGQGGHFRLMATVNRETEKLGLKVNLNYIGLNAAQALDAARFLQALSRGGEFRMVGTAFGTDSRLAFLRASIQSGDYGGPNPQNVGLLEKMAYIQDQTGAQFSVPGGEISQEDLGNLNGVAHILQTGRFLQNIAWWETTIGLEQARGILQMFQEGKPRPVVFYYPEEQASIVLGVKAPLGPAMMGVRQTYMTDEDIDRLRKDLEVSGPAGSIRARLSPFQDCQVEFVYMRWLPVGEAAAIYRMPFFKDIAPEEFLKEVLRGTRERDFIHRFPELLAALRENITDNEATQANYLVTCSPEELLEALSAFWRHSDAEPRFVLAAMLFGKDVLSSGKAARLAGMDRVTFLLKLHTVGVPMIDLDDEQLASQASYVNSR